MALAAKGTEVIGGGREEEIWQSLNIYISAVESGARPRQSSTSCKKRESSVWMLCRGDGWLGSLAGYYWRQQGRLAESCLDPYDCVAETTESLQDTGDSGTQINKQRAPPHTHKDSLWSLLNPNIIWKKSHDLPCSAGLNVTETLGFCCPWGFKVHSQGSKLRS